jgi:hypothetical protein
MASTGHEVVGRPEFACTGQFFLELASALWRERFTASFESSMDDNDCYEMRRLEI